MGIERVLPLRASSARTPGGPTNQTRPPPAARSTKSPPARAPGTLTSAVASTTTSVRRCESPAKVLSVARDPHAVEERGYRRPRPGRGLGPEADPDVKRPGVDAELVEAARGRETPG